MHPATTRWQHDTDFSADAFQHAALPQPGGDALGFVAGHAGGQHVEHLGQRQWLCQPGQMREQGLVFQEGQRPFQMGMVKGRVQAYPIVYHAWQFDDRGGVWQASGRTGLSLAKGLRSGGG